MKQYIITLVLLIAALVAFPTSHANGQSQVEMNRQVAKDFEKADAELNRTYATLMAKVPDAEGKEKLKQSQRAWLAFRDAEASFAAYAARGGSMSAVLRYTSMTETTEQRIKQLKLRSELLVPAKTTEPESSEPPDQGSVSPDKKWEYADEDGPKIVKAGTNEVPLDLDCKGGVLWAPDSKRVAFNCGGGGRWHTTSLYQLRGDQWKELKSPSPEDEVLAVAEKAIAAQVKKRGLPKKTDLRFIWGTLEVRQWVDSNTAILYAGLEEAVRENLDEAFGAHFLVTLKFDEAGNSKIVKTHRMSDKEVEEHQ